MKNNQNDQTIKEILKEEQGKNGTKPRKKSCLMRGFLLLILLTILFFSFIFIQQSLLNIEAEAIVGTLKTATAMAKIPKEKYAAETDDPSQHKNDISDQQLPTETPTLDPNFERTATIAVQLTSVAEFQLTITKEP
jgi:hypothetical protein